MIIKYVAVQTHNMNEESNFLQDVLGYKVTREIELWEGVHCKLFSKNDHSFHLILIPGYVDFKGKSIIVLNTNNCLEDYHKMKSSGVKFQDEPHYLGSGLLAEFEDSSGNHFILLEEREYEEI